jgi:hypothetical protein
MFHGGASSCELELEEARYFIQHVHESSRVPNSEVCDAKLRHVVAITNSALLSLIPVYLVKVSSGNSSDTRINVELVS